MENNKLEVIQKLDNSVVSVIGSDKILGFNKAYMVADAIGELKTLLVPEYMKPIMALQGNKLGFKTDKDVSKEGAKGVGYPAEIVKNCLIEAVLYGVQPTGNQFNIIAGNMYVTKEGMGYLLSKIAGLKYDIVFQLPRINNDKSGAAIVAKISWTMNGEKNEKDIEIPVKMNAYMGTDAVVGKATRKARKWLHDTITGTEIPDGSIEDADSKVMETKLNEIQVEDLLLLFEMKKATMSVSDARNAQRIIDTKEVNSYKKLQTQLQNL